MKTEFKQQRTRATARDFDQRVFEPQGQGQVLDAQTRAMLEPRFGHSFGDVRVYADGQADQLAQRHDARAMTVGQDVYFASGEYDPQTPSGMSLLAHELTHTIQQRGARFDGRPLEVSQRGDAGEREADAAARSVASGGIAHVQASGNLMIQRREICDEEGVCRSGPDEEPNSSQQNYVKLPPEEVYGPPAPPKQNFTPAPPPAQNSTSVPSPEQANQPPPSPEQANQQAPAINPRSQEIADQIEAMGGDCYDVSRISYSALLEKRDELRKKNPATQEPSVRKSSPNEFIEGRVIRYLDDTGGIPRVKTRYERGTKTQLDDLENEELQKIAAAQMSGLLSGAKAAGGRIPSPGQSWIEPGNAQGTRPSTYQEPPK